MQQFTDEQHEVVMHRGQHAVVSAVAGSGKTTVLVARNQALVDAGMDPRRVLNVVFNKSAQTDFQRRINERMGQSGTQVRTFHSMGLKMLERLKLEGFKDPFDVDGDGNKLSRLARECLLKVWDPKNRGEMYACADEFAPFISLVKADLGDAATTWRHQQYAEVTRPFIHAFELYEEERKQRHLIGYDDMIWETAKLLQDNPETWGLFNGFFHEVMSDESQDLNPVQLYLLEGVVGKKGLLMAVGDDDQAIYGWRGANSKIFAEQMPKMFAPCRLMKLTWNFRYGHATSLAANAVIHRNKSRTAKMTVAHPSNPKTALTVLPQRDLGPLIARLQAAKRAGTLSDICLLVREYDHAVRFELALAAAQVPYHVKGRGSLASVQEVAAFVALLSLWVGGWEDPSEETQARAMDALMRTPTLFLTTSVQAGWLAAVRGSQDAQQFLEGSQHYVRQLDRDVKNAEVVKRLEERLSVLQTIWGMPATYKPGVAIGAYVGLSRLDETVRKAAATEEKAHAILGNVSAVREAAERFGSVKEMLEGFERAMAMGKNVQPQEQCVLITSLHRSKGLEWPLVVIGTFGKTAFGDANEEERRLAYVGITRAQGELIVLSDDADTIRSPSDPNGDGRGFLKEAMLGDAINLGDALNEGRQGRVTVGNERLFSAYLDQVGDSGLSAVARAAPAARSAVRAGSGVASGPAQAEAKPGLLCGCGRFNDASVLSRSDPRCMCGKALKA